jgi:hypothetical protein
MATIQVTGRECKDIPWLLIFVLFCGGMVAVASMGRELGDPNRVLYGTDSYGNLCSTDNTGSPSMPHGLDMTGKAFLFYAIPTDPERVKICVATCPSRGPTPDELLSPTIDNTYCDTGFSGSPTASDVWLPLPGFDGPNRSCYHGYESTPVLNRCIATIGANVTMALIAERVGALDLADVVMSSIIGAKFTIAACCFLAVGLSFVWLLCLRFFAGYMVYACLGTTMVTCLAITSLLWAQVATQVQESMRPFQEQEHQALVGVAVLATMFSLGLILFLAFFLKRIRIAVGVIEEGSRAIQAIPTTLLLPLLLFVVLGGFIGCWAFVWAYVWTAGEPQFDHDGEYLGYYADVVVKLLQWYHVFGVFWMTNFIVALGQVTIAGAVASWHGVRQGVELPAFPVVASLERALRYHMGSLALGSLVIASVRVVRICLEYVDRQTRASELPAVRFVVKCLQCCLWSLDRFVKFMTTNAFIQVAIHGYAFMPAARQAWTVLTANGARLSMLEAITFVLLSLGKLAIALVTFLVAFFVMKDDPSANLYLLPCLLVGLLAFLIATVFMEVLEMAIRTIFLCVCEDMANNKPKDGESSSGSGSAMGSPNPDPHFQATPS